MYRALIFQMKNMNKLRKAYLKLDYQEMEMQIRKWKNMKQL